MRSMPSGIRKKPAKLKPSQVAESIRQAIFQGQYKPGDPLLELHLAEQFHVSQATVREALASLAHAGLVRRFPNKGSFVTSLSPREVAELVRLRALLEELAAGDAALRASLEEVSTLKSLLAEMKSAAEAGDYYGAAQADLAFHRAVWKLSGDGTLCRVLDQVTVPLFAFESVRRSLHHDTLSHLLREHEELLDAIASRNSGRAREAARLHIERAYAARISLTAP